MKKAGPLRTGRFLLPAFAVVEDAGEKAHRPVRYRRGRRVLNRLGHKTLLAVKRFPGAGQVDVAAVGQELARLDVVGEAGVENIVQLAPRRGVGYRTGHLHAAAGVAGHEVSGGDVHHLVRALAEAVDARVLQIAPDDAYDADVFRLARHAGEYAADAADDKVYLDARLRGLAQLADEVDVGQRVYLDEHPPGLALGDLAVHQRRDA